ncbi:MAG: hypothetical protein ABFD82_04100 [Syntrophaceae bacterium]
MKKIVFAALLLILNASFCMAGDPYQAAESSAQQALDHFGSADAVQANAVNPLTGGGALSTIDDTQQGTAQISCPASDKFMTVLINCGSTNDLSMVNIYQDADLDGTVEYTYTLPFPVSGVCANGVISCDAGAWTNCNYYQWTADSNGYVTTTNVGSITSLGGCYCINNSCGANLVWTNLNNILKDLGGGIVGAIQAQKAQYTISSVTASGTTISYTGQDEKQCSSGTAYNSGTSTPQIYAGTQASTVQAQKYTDYSSDMENATAQEVTRQSSDPQSYYSMLSQAASNQNAVSQSNSCAIKRYVTVQTTTLPCSPGTVYDAQSDTCVIYANNYTPQLFVNGGGHNGCYFQYTPSPLGGDDLYIGNYLCGDPWKTIYKNVRIIYTCGGVQYILYSVEYQTVHFPYCPSNDMTFIEGYYYTATSCSIDCSYYSGSFPLNCTMCAYNPNKQDVLSDTVDDQCVGLENNSSCRLQNETVDGVNTFTNYQVTGLSPLPQCKTYTGAQSHQVCHDWWEKDRVYQCQQAQTYDFSDLKRRTEVIAGSVTGNINKGMTYNDAPRDANGNIISTSGFADLSQASKISSYSCEQACKTRRPKQSPLASLSGTDNMYQNSTISYEFLFHKCNNGVCPAGTGETILKNCQCIDDFAESVSIMAALSAAGRDLICSSGTKQ